MGSDDAQLLLVQPREARGRNDDEVHALVYRALNVQKPSWFRDAVELPIPVRLSKQVAVKRSMDYLVELYRFLTRDVDAAALAGIKVLKQGAAELQELRCPARTFSVGVVYAQHPVDSAFYIPLSDFHNHVLEDKAQEFLVLCGGLGAVKVEASHEHAHNRTAGASFGVDGYGKGTVAFEQRMLAKLTSSARFNELDRQPPCVPPNLRWIAYEPEWNGMIRARLESKLMEREISFEYVRSYSVTAKLAARIDALGLECGGEFSDFSRVSVRLKIVFA